MRFLGKITFYIKNMFTSSSKSIIYGRHLDVAQRMLDFDFLSGRSPSVAGMIDPSAHRTTVTKLFFGNREILIPIYPGIDAIPVDSFCHRGNLVCHEEWIISEYCDHR